MVITDKQEINKDLKYSCRIQNGLSHCICLDDIIKLPQNIREALCTELYFSLGNPEILGDVSNTILWDYLLSNNEIKILKLWIDAKYNQDVFQKTDDIEHYLKSLLTNLSITSDMIESIDSTNASDLTKHLTKNHLSKYVIII